MASIDSGIHTISRTNLRLHLALESTRPKALISAEMATGRRFEEQWHVETLPNNKVLLRNHRYSERYLSFEGKPGTNKLLLAENLPKQWSLRPYRARPDTYFIVVSGDDGEEAAKEYAVELLLSPPMLALRPIRPDDQSQTWLFNTPKPPSAPINSNRAH